MKSYPVVLYLNQKYVFDILAVMEDGISQLEIIKTTFTSDEKKNQEIGGQIGTNNIFGFLGVTLQGKKEKGTSLNDTLEKSTEKTHTPNSLFAKMRERLIEQEFIKTIDSCSTGDFIEIKLRISKNPLIDALEQMLSLLELSVIFEDPKPKNQFKQQTPSNKGLIPQFKKVLEQLNSNPVIDILGNISGNEKNIIITIDKNYLGDQSMRDLSDCELTLLGKVTHQIEKGSDEKINLLRKTSLSSVQGQLLNGVVDSFTTIEENGIKLPKVITEIDGPVVQILPIAIFS